MHRALLRFAGMSLGLLSCAPAARRAYLAPSSETVTSDTEVRQAEPPMHTIVVQNRSTVPVTVFSVALSSCENIKQSCGPRPVNLRVPAGARVVAMRVEADNQSRSFSYRFGFSWRVDSSSAALDALARSGDTRAQEQLALRRRADSLRRTETGPRYNELSRDDFKALAAQATALRAEPDSIVIEPGAQASVEQVRVLLVNAQGQVLGRTRWVRWQGPNSAVISFLPPDKMLGRRPGRGMLRFSLADEAQQLLTNEIAMLEVPVIVGYPHDPHGPVFAGRALDADTKSPLSCARVILEDDAHNAIASTRANAAGEFSLRAPRPGTYRVGVDAHGWATVFGAPLQAIADEEKRQDYPVRFTEQVLAVRNPMVQAEFEHARPAAVRVDPVRTGSGRSAPIVQGVTLGGSESMPILGIISTRVRPMTTWMQFVVDSAGHADTASILLPASAEANATTSVVAVMPRVRFTPAKESGKPVCEMLRMQVNFTPR